LFKQRYTSLLWNLSLLVPLACSRFKSEGTNKTKQNKTIVAAVNRTRGSCMASTNFTTKPLRLFTISRDICLLGRSVYDQDQTVVVYQNESSSVQNPR
jgi:hypothetical protein